jgi:hypothetical protein
MHRVTAGIAAAARTRWRHATAPAYLDRGEFGPISYALMVAAVVLLAGAIIIWGQDLADQFMGRLDDFDFDDPRSAAPGAPGDGV